MSGPDEELRTAASRLHTTNARRDILIELARHLTLADLEFLITTRAEDIDVFVGTIGNCVIGGELSKEVPITPNGAMLQLNVEFTELDDMREDEFIAHALLNAKPLEEVLTEKREKREKEH